MGIPGSGTAFFSILKYFLLCCTVFSLVFFIFARINNVPVMSVIKEAPMVIIIYIVCIVAAYSYGLINGINIGRTK